MNQISNPDIKEAFLKDIVKHVEDFVVTRMCNLDLNKDRVMALKREDPDEVALIYGEDYGDLSEVFRKDIVNEGFCNYMLTADADKADFDIKEDDWPEFLGEMIDLLEDFLSEDDRLGDIAGREPTTYFDDRLIFTQTERETLICAYDKLLTAWGIIAPEPEL